MDNGLQARLERETLVVRCPILGFRVYGLGFRV